MANFSSFKRPPELVKISEDMLTMDSEADQKAITKKAIRFMADEALVVPIFFAPAAVITQPTVHTDYLDQGLNRWKQYDMWIEKK
jgi:hypothetical protein